MSELDSQFIGIMSEDHLDLDQLTDLHKRIVKMVKESDEGSDSGDTGEIRQNEAVDISDIIKSDDGNSEGRVMADMELLRKSMKI